MNVSNLSNLLVQWYKDNTRDLPWRKDASPYNIWVSEIILQQTQMNRGVEYYQRFIEKYPNIQTLAKAEEKDVLIIWQGLGYYSRARNILTAAKQIADKYKCNFPETYEDLISLKGIGDYTASAILSIAFNKPFIVADGNVLRLISRLFAIRNPVDQPQTVRRVKALAGKMMQGFDPSIFNQAMMELGALVCKPQNPDCNICPLSHHCKAFSYGIQRDLPLKAYKQQKKSRFFHYFIFISKDESVYIYQRQQNDIWQNLWEFPLTETGNSKFPSIKKIKKHFQVAISRKEIQKSFYKKHVLTHQVIHAFFYLIIPDKKPISQERDFKGILFSEISKYPVHNLMKLALKRLMAESVL